MGDIICRSCGTAIRQRTCFYKYVRRYAAESARLWTF